ncbi:hypothetical protein [Nannocystis sp.]|uniref:hypothetical protein n=1 Tax=Nannocystis sp. TaxID=1962667 RepID=UPI0025F7D650|nr:hypothetical protein [Nannocystis sp.]MBK7825317.1 hypothetical protein [Nannocystis sp.]
MTPIRSLSLSAALALAACSDDTGNGSSDTTKSATTDASATAPTSGDSDNPTTTASSDSEPGTTAGTTTATTADDPTTDGPAPTTVPLSPTDHLVRVSMALRGVRPSADDLADVAADPTLLPMFVDDYLADPRFAETVKDIYAEALLVRAQLNGSMLAYRGPLLDLDDATYMASTPEEPLQLIAWVVSDPTRSFSEIVTTDTVMVDEIGATAWHVSGYDKQTGGWQPVQWSDDRPKGGGVLASSALWHRHASNGNNYQRARANLVSRVFLCDDYLTRDVPPFNDVDFSDPDAVNNALQQNPGCQGCHQTLDPLAGYFWGVASRGRAGLVQAYDAMDGVTCLKPDVCYPTTEYELDFEDDWKTKTKRTPGYFGVPEAEGGVDKLGLRIAADPRFAQCTARRFYSYMAQVHQDAVPFALVARFTDALDQDGKLDVRALAREIVLSDEFRASHSLDAEEAETLVGYKVARPEQLARMFKELAGFDWYGIRTADDINGEFSLLGSDAFGYRAMAGGIDGYSITQPTHTFNPTRTLVLQALAAEAAGYVVDRDFDLPAKATLLTELKDSTGDEPGVRAQIALLHARVLAELVAADSPEVDQSFALWTAVAGDNRQKWKILLTAMFQDHRLTFY